MEKVKQPANDEILCFAQNDMQRTVILSEAKNLVPSVFIANKELRARTPRLRGVRDTPTAVISP